MKKTIVALTAATALTAAMATAAMAAPGHMGHAGHIGGAPHMGGGHFHGGRGIGGAALGAGLGGFYDFAGPGYDGYDACYQNRLVPTPFGLRYRVVDVCDY